MESKSVRLVAKIYPFSLALFCSAPVFVAVILATSLFLFLNSGESFTGADEDLTLLIGFALSGLVALTTFLREKRNLAKIHLGERRSAVSAGLRLAIAAVLGTAGLGAWIWALYRIVQSFG